MREITVTLPTLHSGQSEIFNNSKRFNVVNCGRRFGKTVLAEDLIAESGIVGHRCAYFAPTYKMLNEVWKEAVYLLAPITKRKDTQQKQITLITGAIIDFWSLDNINSARGRKYHRVIIDEAAFVAELEEAWLRVIRPMLTDYAGDAWFLSTPQGFENYFRVLFDNEQTLSNWKSFKMPTSANPYIPKSELEEAKQTLPTDVYEQEYEAEFVRFNGKLFFSEWSEEYIKPQQFDPMLDLYLCFDFNIANTCLWVQNADGKVKVIKEYHYEANLDQFCENIREELSLYSDSPFIIINGDASGNSGSAGNNDGLYQTIKSVFNLSWNQFNVPKSNPSHQNSRVLCNVALKAGMIEIDPSCEGLLRDIRNVKVLNKGGKISIDKSDETLTHYSDPLRYHLNVEHRDLLRDLGSKE